MWRAGKTAIEVAPVGQIPRVVEKTKGVHNRHNKQCPAQLLEGLRAQEPTDNLNPDHLVAMNPSADKNSWPVLLPVHHMRRQRHRRVV